VAGRKEVRAGNRAETTAESTKELEAWTIRREEESKR
jgi:hypothetical protein